MPIYTLNSCTIEVAKGRQSAKATRHAEGKPPESAEFKVLGVDGAPTPEVQAQRWAMGMPEWEPKTPDKTPDKTPEIREFPENATPAKTATKTPIEDVFEPDAKLKPKGKK